MSQSHKEVLSTSDNNNNNNKKRVKNAKKARTHTNKT